MHTESKPISEAFPLARSILKWDNGRLSTSFAQVTKVARVRPVIDALHHTLSYVHPYILSAEGASSPPLR